MRSCATDTKRKGFNADLGAAPNKELRKFNLVHCIIAPMCDTSSGPPIL